MLNAPVMSQYQAHPVAGVRETRTILGTGAWGSTRPVRDPRRPHDGSRTLLS